MVNRFAMRYWDDLAMDVCAFGVLLSGRGRIKRMGNKVVDERVLIVVKLGLPRTRAARRGFLVTWS